MGPANGTFRPTDSDTIAFGSHLCGSAKLDSAALMHSSFVSCFMKDT